MSDRKEGPANEIHALTQIVRRHPILGALLRQWHSMGLADCWLSGSAIAQAVWNATFDLAPEHGLADVDLVYFDKADLSEASEAGEAARIARSFAHLPVRLDVKNQARVHLWYPSRFGYSIAPYTSVAQAIATFPTTSAAIGIRPGASDLLDCVAPYGLSDLLKPIVRPNRVQVTKAIYDGKVARWRELWPGLEVIEWLDT